MQTATFEQRQALRDAAIALRPDWSPVLVLNVLDAHAHQTTAADLAVALMRCAAEPDTTPKMIAWRGRWWRDLKTQPERVSHQLHRCGVCGKPEDQCMTQRPGPDDHAFEPTGITA